MKNFLILILISVLSINIYSQSEMEKVNSILKEIKEKFAPDKRVAVFNIESSELDNKVLLKGETNLPEVKTELLKMIDQTKIKFEDQIEILPSENLGDKKFGVINLSAANLRLKPDHPAELVTQSILGTPIKVLKKGEDGFYLVQTPDGYISWLDNDGFAFMDESELKDWLSSPKIIYTKVYGFSYTKADENSQPVSDLVEGNLLKIIGEENNFFLINYPDGRVAYVKKDEAKLFIDWYKALNPTGETILNTAYHFMGIPYLWGGTSTKGMDCSGFTKTVYFLNGIILSRDASQQVNTGELVDTKDGWQNLQAGDLLFFGRRANGDKKERITHVAIYIGDGDFIHAAGRVKINSFNPEKSYYSDYRKSGFIRAKRILTSVGKNGIEKILENDFYSVKTIR
ncbi:MAG TPA: C40 family peptidase [Ignavibacteriaceae bacterium]|nr:C40 family peptidase [Ignavibacterium sp.]HRN27655.1 C40 family peptidase [Ignavibacteriaceae bacterium]HRP93788.1 C40 family peptidase [Ignavibacteriaceae bacterium]HRQ55533.1 C40 family peptidase [Ignavibacteriaceae bacterium]